MHYEERREDMQSFQGQSNEDTRKVIKGNLRKAYSDVSSEIKRSIGQEEEEVEEEQEVKLVKCDCCGIEEECTLQYIEKVKNLYSDKWVCGLCADVVTERCLKYPQAASAMQEALEWHRGICETFNSTTRLNPKLGFVRTMLQIAKRSSHNRSPEFSLGSKITRSISCDPRLET